MYDGIMAMFVIGNMWSYIWNFYFWNFMDPHNAELEDGNSEPD